MLAAYLYDKEKYKMIGLIIYLCVVSFVLLAGLFGTDNDKDKQNYLSAFYVCITAIVFVVFESIH